MFIENSTKSLDKYCLNHRNEFLGLEYVHWWRIVTNKLSTYTLIPRNERVHITNIVTFLHRCAYSPLKYCAATALDKRLNKLELTFFNDCL